jgi:hypothetical protein
LAFSIADIVVPQISLLAAYLRHITLNATELQEQNFIVGAKLGLFRIIGLGQGGRGVGVDIVNSE